MSRSQWARGSNQYIKRPQPQREASEVSLHESPVVSGQRERTGIVWQTDELDYSHIQPSEVERARARFRSQLPELIWDAAKLEGNDRISLEPLICLGTASPMHSLPYRSTVKGPS